MSGEHSDYYKAKLETGLEFQDFVVRLAWDTLKLAIVQYTSRAFQYKHGESLTGVEIKHDEMFKTTGNLWIEVAAKSDPKLRDYTPSGIFAPDNAWLYVIGDYHAVFFFPKNRLQQHSRSEFCQVVENNMKTSRGFLLSRTQAEYNACYVWRENGNGRR